MKQQLTTYLSENGLFYESQFAHRRQCFMEDAVGLAINRWLTAMTKHKYSGVVMVDMWKAFDLVKHSRLIAELFSIGISGLALQCFCSYLAEIFQQIEIGDNLSSSTACSNRSLPRQCPCTHIVHNIHVYIYMFIYTHTQKENYERPKFFEVVYSVSSDGFPEL